MAMTEHASKQYDLDLGSIRSRVLAMGGLVESQIRRAIDSLTSGNVALSDEVIAADHKVNALGVELGSPIVDGSEVTDRAALGVGDPPDADFMQSAVGLVWRATVLWMLLLFLLGLASLVG